MSKNFYGSIKHVVTDTSRVWCIQAEPFVNSRLKRVFPRVPQAAAKTINLSTSPENSRELAWFIQRYPMDMSKSDRDLLLELAEQHQAAEQRLADLIAGLIPPSNITLAEPAREYQTFAAQLVVLQGALLLADQLGLGKTVSAIASLVHANAYPAVVVAPAHLTRQWVKQLRRFVPGLNTYLVKKGTPWEKPGVLVNMTGKRRKKSDAMETKAVLPDVLVITYDMLKGWAEFLAPIAKFAIWDEVQALRHSGSDRYAASVRLAGGVSYRLGLSATPIYGYGAEFYNVLNILRPDALGSYNEFYTEWCTNGGGRKASIEDPYLFGEYMRREGLMLRRTRKEVGRELPPLTKIVHEIEADEKKLEDLAGNAVELAKIVLSHNQQYKGQKMLAAAEFDVMMRQATGIAKAPYVVEFVKMLLDSGEKVVLFGYHRAVYDIWMEGLKEFNPVMYTGSESGNQKDASVKAFVEGDSQLLIMSVRSGSGADGLQAASCIAVVGELDWSPAIIEQCFGRLDRDGQESPVTGYILVSESGSDPVMMEVLGIKREQIEGVILLPEEQTLIERIDVGENTLARMAREFLIKRGVPLPEPEAEQALALEMA